MRERFSLASYTKLPWLVQYPGQNSFANVARDPVPQQFDDARLGPHMDTLDPLGRRGTRKWKRRYELEAADHEVTAAERDEAIRVTQKLAEREKVLKGLVKELQVEREDVLFELRTTQELHETVAAETIQAELVDAITQSSSMKWRF